MRALKVSPPKTTIMTLDSRQNWEAWLDGNHRTSSGIWLRLAKKGSTLQTVTYKDALEVALCYGWIDGQKKPESSEAWLQRFLPRSGVSLWSKINREKVSALMEAGKLKPAGLEAVENARRTGRWDAAYDSPRTAVVPPDLAQALAANARAKQFFESLDSANRYAILWRIQTVKRAETRSRKIAHFIEMLQRDEKVHP
jgi:uncharacterized protein YdeI (YjbR/CyaY-like superfamily)